MLSHGILWVLFGLLFVISLSGVQSLRQSGVLVASILGLSLPAVYFHFYLVEKLLRRKRAWPYIISVLALVVVYGRCMNYVFEEWLFAEEDGTYIVGEFILIVFLLMASGLHYFVKGLQAKGELAEAEAKRTQAELDSLKLQMSPHFLFNSLNNIYGLMEEDSESSQALLRLSSLLRYMLDTSDKTTVDLADEVQFIEDYIAMERLRLEACDIAVLKSGAFDGYQVPPLLMMPFVENAFKHGQLNAKGSFVRISIGVEAGDLLFGIENTVNMEAVSGHQMGISNAKRRLELLGKPYKLHIHESKAKFHVKLSLAL